MSVITYKCPHCGAELVFDPATQKAKCEFCLSNFTLDELENSKKVQKSEPTDILEEELGKDEGKASKLYTCPSCGAEIITDTQTSATLCCYCHNPVVFTKQLEGEFRPSKVIPFKLSREQAIEAFLSWQKKKHFLPNDFASPNQLEKIAGMYIPYWLVDCKVQGAMSGRGKNISSWRSGDYQYTKTDEFALYREATMAFDLLPHDASSKADDQVMESIGPFDCNALEDFSQGYLSGFFAEKYDVNKEDVYPIIKSRVEQAVKVTLRESMRHYTVVDVRGSQIQFNKTSFHYTLMPVWILTYIYKNETYLFAMNGQTGKLYGRVPLNTQKLAIFCSLLFLAVLILCSLGGLML